MHPVVSNYGHLLTTRERMAFLSEWHVAQTCRSRICETRKHISLVTVIPPFPTAAEPASTALEGTCPPLSARSKGQCAACSWWEAGASAAVRREARRRPGGGGEADGGGRRRCRAAGPAAGAGRGGRRGVRLRLRGALRAGRRLRRSQVRLGLSLCSHPPCVSPSSAGRGGSGIRPLLHGHRRSLSAKMTR